MEEGDMTWECSSCHEMFGDSDLVSDVNSNTGVQCDTCCPNCGTWLDAEEDIIYHGYRWLAAKESSAMAYNPPRFDRESYLNNKDVFESESLCDVESELCEFNEDVEDMAFELAYTRYHLAKAERAISLIANAKDMSQVRRLLILHGHHFIVEEI